LDETVIRRISAEDDHAIEGIIRSVMTSFDLDRTGSALHDPEVSEMAAAYSEPGHAYFVTELNGEIVAGAGIGPLAGGDGTICELRKMYALPLARGRGIGKKLLMLCLDEARKLGYRTCYIETIEQMTDARHLYMKVGFTRLDRPMGDTGHCACDMWYSLDL